MLGLAFASRRRLHTVAPGRQLAALLCAPRPRRAVRRLAPNARGSFWMARCASGRPLDSPPHPQAARATLLLARSERACADRPRLSRIRQQSPSSVPSSVGTWAGKGISLPGKALRVSGEILSPWRPTQGAWRVTELHPDATLHGQFYW